MAVKRLGVHRRLAIRRELAGAVVVTFAMGAEVRNLRQRIEVGIAFLVHHENAAHVLVANDVVGRIVHDIAGSLKLLHILAAAPQRDVTAITHRHAPCEKKEPARISPGRSGSSA